MIKISPLQKSNPVLKVLNKSTWYFDKDLTCDYEINSLIAIFYLSFKYHMSKPEYILKRINRMKKDYRIKVLVVQLDVVNFKEGVKELFKIEQFTQILCKDTEEFAEYIKGFNVSKEKEIITTKKRSSSLDAFLLDIPKLTIVDIRNIYMKYNNLQNFISSSEEDLEDNCGFSNSKAKKVLEIFKKSFRKQTKP